MSSAGRTYCWWRACFGKLVEEGRIDVVADPEREETRVRRVLGGDIFENIGRLQLAEGRLSVGEEDDGKRSPFIVGPQFQG